VGGGTGWVAWGQFASLMPSSQSSNPATQPHAGPRTCASDAAAVASALNSANTSSAPAPSSSLSTRSTTWKGRGLALSCTVQAVQKRRWSWCVLRQSGCCVSHQHARQLSPDRPRTPTHAAPRVSCDTHTHARTCSSARCLRYSAGTAPKAAANWPAFTYTPPLARHTSVSRCVRARVECETAM
jgi:hypothetical protein